MSQRRGKILGLLLLVAVVALVAVGAYASRQAVGEELAWGTVERQDLVLGVGVSGTLEAIDSATLGPPALARMWNYRIAFMAPEGAQVRQGQPVLAFDPRELQQQLQQRIADRDSAQKEIEKKQADLEARREQVELRLAEARAKKRRAELQLETPESLVAETELAKQRVDLELARKEIAYLEDRLELLDRQRRAEIGSLEERRTRAAARVRELEEQIARMTVQAPRDGIVIYVSDWEGAKKKVGDSVWRGNQILEIPDLNRMQASGAVDEADVAQIAAGQPVSIRLDAHPDVEYQGTVERIARTVQARTVGDPVKVVRLEIDLSSTDTGRMRPGMRFRGKVETERVDDALVVPAEAVVASPDGPVVYVEGFMGPKPVRPELGRRTERWVEVEAGLAEGDRVLLEPAAALDGGDGGSLGLPAAGGAA